MTRFVRHISMVGFLGSLCFTVAAGAQCNAWDNFSPGVFGTDAYVYAMGEYNGSFIAGGLLSSYNGTAMLNGGAWQQVGGNFDKPGVVNAMTLYQGDLVAAGFGVLGAPDIAHWNGSAWLPFGAGVSGTVNALAVYNGDLIAAGSFNSAGGKTVNRIARWDGKAWHSLAGGANGTVQSLTVYNGELIAGGLFTSMGGQPAARIARWNGATWQPLGAGMGNASVRALTVYEGTLIAAGAFLSAGGQPANRIARWDGAGWQPLGDGVDDTVLALTVFGTDLIAGGRFDHAGGQTAIAAARWNGTNWVGLLTNLGTDEIETFYVYNGQLLAGIRGNNTINGIKRWVGCPPACCLPDNTCTMVDAATCEQLGGVCQGTGTTCTSNPDCSNPCPADLNGSNSVDIEDLLLVLNGWGACAPPCPPRCSSDATNDCNVSIADLLLIINNWDTVCTP